MRIFSKFHDYYDTSLKYGIDPTILYVRKEVDITELIEKNKKHPLWSFKEDLFKFRERFNYNSNKFSVTNRHIILFCGKVYFCYEISYQIGNSLYPFYPITKTENVYTWDALKNPVHKYAGVELDAKEIRNFESLFARQGEKSEMAFKMHFELDTPVILLSISPRGKQTVIKNPSLKKIEFYKVVNPVVAFQELSMFIGGVIGGKSPAIVTLSDKDRITKHGFDKYSFRKEKIV